MDIEFLYTRYGPMVLRRCRYILKDEEQALDAMQDVFVKVLEKEKQLTQQAPSSLLYTMATRVCLNILRDRKESSPVDEQTLPARDSQEQRIEQQWLVDEIFQNEKESTRVIAYLHYMDRLTLEDVAGFVNLSVSGVRKRLRRLRTTGERIWQESV